MLMRLSVGCIGSMIGFCLLVGRGGVGDSGWVGTSRFSRTMKMNSSRWFHIDAGFVFLGGGMMHNDVYVEWIFVDKLLDFLHSSPAASSRTATALCALIHVDGLQLALQFGRNRRRWFGWFPQDEPLKAAAELFPESLQTGLLELDQCILDNGREKDSHVE